MAVQAPDRTEPVGGEAPAFSRGGELMIVGFGFWMIVGLFLDGVAHSEQKPDSFFTPWHGVLYTGFVGAAAAAFWQARSLHRPGDSWRHAIPASYRASFVGLALFAAGGVGDLFWHQIFGIEANLAALLSPTHLLLMVGGLLALTGPLRTEWRSGTDAPTLRNFLPALGSVALGTGVVHFFTFYLSPFGRTVVARFLPAETDIHDLSVATPAAFAQLRETWAIGGIVFTTVLVVVPLLLLLRRWRLPAGALLLYFGAVALFEGAASEFRRWPLALAVLAAGAVADALARRVSLRVIAAVVPAVLWVAYFALIAVVYDLRWSAELWTGAVVLSILIGLGLSLLVDERAAESPPLVRLTGADGVTR